MIDIQALVVQLEVDEGFKLINSLPVLYDDATGHAIIPGYMLVGHPTAGYGFALDVWPLSQPESLTLLNSRALTRYYELIAALPWVLELSEPRQRALANMSYNLGVAGLSKFNTFISFMKSGDFNSAVSDLTSTAWYKQVGARAVRIAALIKVG